MTLAGAALLTPAMVSAQGEPAAAVQVAADTKAPDTAAYTTPQSTFQPSSDLEELRYKHLWMAYAVIWLTVFVFIWRTWKQSQQTAKELASLKLRLAEMESQDG